MARPVMNQPERIEVRWWLYGLLAFAIVLALSAPLQTYTEYGIVAHQAAGSAAQVDRIQAVWSSAGLRPLGIAAMIGDLIFIGIYSFGSWKAGQSCRKLGTQLLRLLGGLICISAVVFCAADCIETTLQFVQMVQDKGSDWMAGTAAFAQPIKMLAWVVTFFGVIAALILVRFNMTADGAVAGE